MNVNNLCCLGVRMLILVALDKGVEIIGYMETFTDLVYKVCAITSLRLMQIV